MDAHTKNQGLAVAVGSMVEFEDSFIADLCSTNPALFGQIDRDDKEQCANAERIALLWNAFSMFTNDELRHEQFCLIDMPDGA